MKTYGGGSVAPPALDEGQWGILRPQPRGKVSVTSVESSVVSRAGLDAVK
jgi:hypothetical protein